MASDCEHGYARLEYAKQNRRRKETRMTTRKQEEEEEKEVTATIKVIICTRFGDLSFNPV